MQVLRISRTQGPDSRRDALDERLRGLGHRLHANDEGASLPPLPRSGALAVLISPGCSNNQVLNAAVHAAHAQGLAVVGIWGEGARPDDVPPAITFFCS